MTKIAIPVGKGREARVVVAESIPQVSGGDGGNWTAINRWVPLEQYRPCQSRLDQPGDAMCGLPAMWWNKSGYLYQCEVHGRWSIEAGALMDALPRTP